MTIRKKHSAVPKRRRPAKISRRMRNRLLFGLVTSCLIVLVLAGFTKVGNDHGSELQEHQETKHNTVVQNEPNHLHLFVSQKSPLIGVECGDHKFAEPNEMLEQQISGKDEFCDESVEHEVDAEYDTEAELEVKLENPKPYTERDVEVVAKTVYGEALITHSDMEMAAVVWCILNRVDSKGFACGGTIEYVTTYPRQFHGYNEDNPVTDHIRELVIDVFERWIEEKSGAENIGRVLPKEYLFFWGDGRHNHFTTEYHGGETWNWEVENPYEN